MDTVLTTPKWEDFFDAMVAYRRKHGEAAATQLLQKVTGQTDLAKVHRSQYAEIMDATHSNKAVAGEQVTSLAAWKKIEADCRNGHAKVLK